MKMESSEGGIQARELRVWCLVWCQEADAAQVPVGIYASRPYTLYEAYELRTGPARTLYSRSSRSRWSLRPRKAISSPPSSARAMI